MNKTIRHILSLAALMATAAIVAGCGGVPGNAVAEVDDSPIEKASFDHWITVAAKAGGQASAQPPRPPDFTACIAAKKKAAAKPAKGQPKATDEQHKIQCRQEYEG